jgi:NAD+ synthase
MKLQAYLDYLVTYLKDYNKSFNGYVLGMSGGLDSALVAKLAHKAVGDDLLCLIINIHNNDVDLRDARTYLKDEKIPYFELDLSSLFDEFVSYIEEKTRIKLSALSKQNVMVRLRMVVLYGVGQTLNKLVLGTTNASEYYTGYFTKWGDGGVDVHTLIYLLKTEIYESSRLLGVPEYFISKKPSAGLDPNQTDEKDLGLTYEELDAFLLGKDVSDKVKLRATSLHNKTNHKRVEIAKPLPYIRDK